MIGGGSGGKSIDIGQYLVNFNAGNWANQANNYLQSALQNGLAYSQNYSQAGINQLQNYNQQANNNLNQGYSTAMALEAPQRMAAYNALDAYTGTLGLPQPNGGSTQMVNQMLKKPSLLKGNQV